MFKLSEKFLESYKDKQPAWGFGDLSYFVYKRTYARTKEDGSQEEWWETCKRVIEIEFKTQEKHCKQVGLPWNAKQAQKTAQDSYDRMFTFKWMPAGRGISNFHEPLIDKIGSACVQNCGVVSTEKINEDFGLPFAWACDMLCCGVGIGYTTDGANKLVIRPHNQEVETYQIPDTREGWADAIYRLLNSYIGDKPKMRFDYSLIRPAGAAIKTFGGIASGPKVLEDGINDISRILDALINKPITSVAISDIMNIIARFVVAGGTRRSALLAAGSINDSDFIDMKNPEKYSEQLRNYRWASNNSVFINNKDDITNVVNHIVLNGEPGLINLYNTKHYGRFKDGFYEEGHDKYDVGVVGYNPCTEQPLRHMELCNLVETFPANHDSVDDYFKTLKVAYLYGKTITLISTKWPETNQVMLQNRRIGLSMSGIQQAIKKFGTAVFFNEFCDKGYEIVRKYDKIYSRWLGIPTSIRVTTVKPSGTTSILAGATPGVHCTHSQYYLRTVRVSANDKLVEKLLKANYRVEISNTDKRQFQKAAKLASQNIGWEDGIIITTLSEGLWNHFKAESGTVVVYFPVKEENFTKSKYQVSLWEQLLLVKEMQHWWSDNGVSCTITFKKNEADDIKSSIEYFMPYVKAMSFLPLDDHHYTQAPYQTCTKDEYEAYKNSLRPLILSDTTNGPQGEKFCSNDVCSI